MESIKKNTTKKKYSNNKLPNISSKKSLQKYQSRSLSKSPKKSPRYSPNRSSKNLINLPKLKKKNSSKSRLNEARLIIRKNKSKRKKNERKRSKNAYDRIKTQTPGYEQFTRTSSKDDLLFPNINYF